MSKAIPFVWSDAWILHAILLAAKDDEATLEDVIGAADGINHAILTFDEIDGGVARLSRAGLIAVRNARFQVLPALAGLRQRVTKLSVRQAADALEKELGIAAAEPFTPTPADPAWSSRAFTAAEVHTAWEAYRRNRRS
jgi:hypothetical protein